VHLSSRFWFVAAGFGSLLALAALPGAAQPVAKASTRQPTVDFNQGWEFVKDVDTVLVKSFFTRENTPGVRWTAVDLPHAAQLEEVNSPKPQWQGYCFYRKTFTLPASAAGQHVAMQFGAAMNDATVYLNGQRVLRHLGGYLPFTADLSRIAKPGQANTVVVKVANVDNPVIPPGKPLKGLDFNFYSGLYRSVQLQIGAPLRISDAVEAGHPAGGGLLVHYENISPQAATLHVRTELQNDLSTAQHADVRAVLFDAAGKEVARAQASAGPIAAGAAGSTEQQLQVPKPKLWSPEQPYRYRLAVEVLQNGRVLERQELHTGIRSIRFSRDGFFLNDEKLRLRGTNRHQEFPYLGYAASDNMQYRDAWKIRQAGFNFVRCSHYPPAPAFLDACDELGLLVMDSTPGWQFFGNEEFAKNSLQNIRDMVRRDRNHPSIVLWEAALNETDMPKPFMDAAHRAVHEELPWAEGVYTCGWLDYAYDVFIPARQHLKAPDYFNKYAGQRPLLLCEYGDWEYYAHNAGFNQTAFAGLKESERTSRQLRGQGERALAQQALNFQEAHNDNFRGPAVGDANWLMFDYKRGYAPDIEASGVADIFRVPKFAYYFYQSQYRSAAAPFGFGKPMVYIANYWQPESSKQVVVYSNCDEVELQLNGKPLARQRPDNNTFSDRLAHPPFTFTVPAYAPGTLTAVGYHGGKAAATTSRRSPGAPQRLRLVLDRSGKDLSAARNDAVFIYAEVVDANGTVVPGAAPSVKFSVQGGATLVGPATVAAEAGVASALVLAGRTAGAVQVTATSEGLTKAVLTIPVK